MPPNGPASPTTAQSRSVASSAAKRCISRSCRRNRRARCSTCRSPAAFRSATAFSPSIPTPRPGRARVRRKPTRAATPRAPRSRWCASSAAWRRADAMARNETPAEDSKANRSGAARLAAVQALYQMDIAGTGLNDILAEFESHWIGREVEGAQYLPAEAAFFRDVVSGVVREQRSLDPLVDKVLAQGWPLKRIEAILRAVLRAGAYELGHRSDVPARVVVSEYVDVANAFVDRDETGMVNAVLDQIARQFRAGEFAPFTR